MVAICVQKSWVEQLGDKMSQLIHFRNESDTCVSLIGGDVKPGFPFVQAEILGASLFDESKTSKSFIPVHIPQ